MSEAPVVDFVMPVYHEEKNVETSVAGLSAATPVPHRILVVYDSDDDPTVPVARALAVKYPAVVLVKNRSRGVLAAILTGIEAAVSELVIVTMADLSDDLSVIPEMVRLIREDGFDVVCPSRYMRGGRQIGGPRIKGMMSRAAGLSLHYLAGLPTHDATNSFRAYRRSALREISVESRGGFELTLELTAKIWARGGRVTEVPSTWRDRTAGKSNFKFRKWLPQYLRWWTWAFLHRPRS